VVEILRRALYAMSPPLTLSLFSAVPAAVDIARAAVGDSAHMAEVVDILRQAW